MGIKKVQPDIMYKARTSWTPSLTSTGTAPSGWAGDSAASVWQRSGDLVIVRGKINHTANASQGTGTWKTSLPVRPKCLTDYQVAGDWYYHDNGLAAFGHMVLNVDSYNSSVAWFGTIMYGNSTWKFLGPGSITNDYSDAGSLNYWLFYEANF